MKLLDNPIFRYHIRTCLCFVHHCVPSQVSFWAHSWCSLNMCWWMNGWLDGWMDRRMVGWTEEWMDGRMDGWKDRRIDRWMDGWMNRWGLRFMMRLSWAIGMSCRSTMEFEVMITLSRSSNHLTSQCSTIFCPLPTAPAWLLCQFHQDFTSFLSSPVCSTGLWTLRSTSWRGLVSGNTLRGEFSIPGVQPGLVGQIWLYLGGLYSLAPSFMMVQLSLGQSVATCPHSLSLA